MRTLRGGGLLGASLRACHIRVRGVLRIVFWPRSLNGSTNVIPSNQNLTYRDILSSGQFFYGAEVVTTRGLEPVDSPGNLAIVRQGLAGRSAHRLDFDHRQSRRRADAAARLARRPGRRASRPRRPASDLQGHEPQRPRSRGLALRLRGLQQHPGHHRRLSDRRLRRPAPIRSSISIRSA